MHAKATKMIKDTNMIKVEMIRIHCPQDFKKGNI